MLSIRSTVDDSQVSFGGIKNCTQIYDPPPNPCIVGFVALSGGQSTVGTVTTPMHGQRRPEPTPQGSHVWFCTRITWSIFTVWTPRPSQPAGRHRNLHFLSVYLTPEHLTPTGAPHGDGCPDSRPGDGPGGETYM